MNDFSNKTYANILAAQLNRVPDTIDKREGSMIQTALGPESWYLEGLYLDLDSVQKNAYAETAKGLGSTCWLRNGALKEKRPPGR
uniref:hypothetical protein n=1 Tax=Clostridium sp. NkU-1 TaxID=1095009 RepID=UPI0006D0E55C